MSSYQNQEAGLIAADIHAYLKQQEHKQLLRLLTCGNVDDGKSTLIGRLLHDSKTLYEDQLEALHHDSKTQGTTGDAPDLALLVDGLQAEREQGITIDVAYRFFSTAKRKFIIADTPGHVQYTRNMATGASGSELAIILVDARKGVQTQTRRHSFIVSLLGIRHVVVAVNKMDLVDYSEACFEQIRADYLAFASQLQLPDIHFVPISALGGDNVVEPSARMPWYQGAPLLGLLENTPIGQSAADQPLRFPVQYVNRPDASFRGYCGTLAAGQVQPGDAVRVLPSGQTSTVRSIVTWEGELDSASAAMAVTLTLNDEIDISRGDLLVAASEHPPASDRLIADLVWMAEQPLLQGNSYLLRIGSRKVNARIASIRYTTDVNSLVQQPALRLEHNEIARVELQLEQAVVADDYHSNRATGSFILIDRHSNNTVAAGMVHAEAPASLDQQYLKPVSQSERATRLGLQPARIELNGGDPALRQQLLQQLERALFERGRLCLNLHRLPPELASQQTALQHWLTEQGLLVLSTQEQNNAELVATISTAEQTIKLPLADPDRGVAQLVMQLEQAGIC